jgi:hypothetical protein
MRSHPVAQGGGVQVGDDGVQHVAAALVGARLAQAAQRVEAHSGHLRRGVGQGGRQQVGAASLDCIGAAASAGADAGAGKLAEAPAPQGRRQQQGRQGPAAPGCQAGASSSSGGHVLCMPPARTCACALCALTVLLTAMIVASSSRSRPLATSSSAALATAPRQLSSSLQDPFQPSLNSSTLSLRSQWGMAPARQRPARSAVGPLA